MAMAASSSFEGSEARTGRLTRLARWLLLGSEGNWAARVGTSAAGIRLLAALTVVSHGLDLSTGLRMMLVHGVMLEQNPIARGIMQSSGPLGLVEMKLGVVLGAVLLFVRTARLGRARLARNCLLAATGIGLLGATSNLVG